jgi:hypothetical protein
MVKEKTFKLAIGDNLGSTIDGKYQKFIPIVETYPFHLQSDDKLPDAEKAAQEYYDFFYDCVPVGVIQILKRKMLSL